jgi:hypothetical protein
MGKPGKKASNIFQNPGIKNNTCNSLPFVKGIGSPLNYGMQRGVGKAVSASFKETIANSDANQGFKDAIAAEPVAKKKKCKKKY